MQYNMSFSTLVILNPPSLISLVGSAYIPHSQHPYSRLCRKKSKPTFRPTIFRLIFSTPDNTLSAFLLKLDALLDFSPLDGTEWVPFINNHKDNYYPRQLMGDASNTVSMKNRSLLTRSPSV
jgi:hypothetical protein